MASIKILNLTQQVVTDQKHRSLTRHNNDQHHLSTATKTNSKVCVITGILKHNETQVVELFAKSFSTFPWCIVSKMPGGRGDLWALN